LCGTIAPALPAAKGKAVGLPAGEQLYASAYYWSAFVLLGDPF
jgi:CHAT domain-containing protein